MSSAELTAPVEGEDRGRSWAAYRPAALLARHTGVTPGEAATILVSVAIALVLTLGGLPPVLRNRGHADSVPASFASSPSPSDVAPTPSTSPPAEPRITAPFTLRPAFTRGTASSGSDQSVARPETSRPSRTIAVPAVGDVEVVAAVATPGAPYGVAVDKDGTMYVSTDNGTARGEAAPSQILAFRPDGSAAGQIVVTGQPEDHVFGLTDLAFGPNGTLTTLDASTGRVLGIDLDSGRQTELATLVDLPACPLVVTMAEGCEPGLQDDAPLARGLAYDANGVLYVTDAAQGTIWRIAPGGAPEPWLSATQFANGDGLGDVVVDPSGSLLVSSPRAMDPGAPSGGAVYRIALGPDGAAQSPALVARFGSADLPLGLALLTDGSFAVSLADAIALIGTDGAEIRRVQSERVDRPSGLAFAGGTLLAANTGGGAEKWALLAVGIR